MTKLLNLVMDTMSCICFAMMPLPIITILSVWFLVFSVWTKLILLSLFTGSMDVRVDATAAEVQGLFCAYWILYAAVCYLYRNQMRKRLNLPYPATLFERWLDMWTLLAAPVFQGEP